MNGDLHVLVVDGQATSLDGLEGMLRAAGFDVSRAASPDGVSEVVQEHLTENARRLADLSDAAWALAVELRSPLAAALSEVSFAAGGRGSDGQRAEALAAALGSLERVRALVERLVETTEGIESAAAPWRGW